MKLTRRAPGMGELEVYFDPAISMEEKIIFSKYVHEHLLQQARDVERLRHYVCPHCGTPVGNREVAMKRLNDWLQNRPPEPDAAGWFKLRKAKKEMPTIICVGCEQRVPLWDEMEECFASPEILQRVRDMQEESAIVLDNESKERALVGEVISTVALAGQICREFNVSDHGIDMEIEFKDDAYEATGAKLYLQLKSGDSYLRERKRRRRRDLHDQGRAPRPLLDGADVPRAAGDSECRGRGPLDGSTRLAEAGERWRQEAGEANRLRRRAVRRDERAPLAGQGVGPGFVVGPSPVGNRRLTWRKRAKAH